MYLTRFGRLPFALICIEWRRFKATTITDSDGQLWAGQLLTLATNINRSRRHEKVSGFCGCNTNCQDSFFTLRTNREKDWENGKRETQWWGDGVEDPRSGGRAEEKPRRCLTDCARFGAKVFRINFRCTPRRIWMRFWFVTRRPATKAAAYLNLEFRAAKALGPFNFFRHFRCRSLVSVSSLAAASRKSNCQARREERKRRKKLDDVHKRILKFMKRAEAETGTGTEAETKSECWIWSRGNFSE